MPLQWEVFYKQNDNLLTQNWKKKKKKLDNLITVSVYSLNVHKFFIQDMN